MSYVTPTRDQQERTLAGMFCRSLRVDRIITMPAVDLMETELRAVRKVPGLSDRKASARMDRRDYMLMDAAETYRRAFRCLDMRMNGDPPEFCRDMEARLA